MRLDGRVHGAGNIRAIPGHDNGGNQMLEPHHKVFGGGFALSPSEVARSMPEPTIAWRAVKRFGSGDPDLEPLIRIGREIGLTPALYETEGGQHAIVLPWAEFHALLRRTKDIVFSREFAGREIAAEDRIALLAPPGSAPLGELLGTLDAAAGADRPLLWWGLVRPAGGASVATAPIPGLDPMGTISLSGAAGTQTILLFRRTTDPTARRDLLAAGPRAEAEERSDNLEGRADWFRRRTGNVE